jgi:hypothetical protein
MLDVGEESRFRDPKPELRCRFNLFTSVDAKTDTGDSKGVVRNSNCNVARRRRHGKQGASFLALPALLCLHGSRPHVPSHGTVSVLIPLNKRAPIKPA